MYEQIGQNKRRTVILMISFMVFVALVVAALNLLLRWGIAGFILAFVIAGASGFFGYWKSDSVALAMSRARRM